MSKLIPEQRTNKNGVTSRRWVLPESSPSDKAADIPAPAVTSPLAQRSKDTAYISEALGKHVNVNSLKMTLELGSGEELRIIAGALEEYKNDWMFNTELAKAVASKSDLVDAVSRCVVYSPDLYPMLPGTLRIRLINEAISEAELYCRTAGQMDDYESWDTDWNLAEEEDSVRRKTKDFVAAWCIISAGTELMHPKDDVMTRVIDETKNDAAAVIDVLRIKPDASVSQIEYMLEGGISALSDGVI